MYSSYTAASFARKHDLAARHGVNLEGALTWAFEFENQAYFAGFRALASNGIPLPVLNVFRMFSKMGAQRVAAESSAQVPLDTMLTEGVRGAPDVAVLASAEPNRLAVMVWHYHDDDLPGPDAAVELALAGLPADAGRGEARPLPHRRAPLQRLRRLEEDGLAHRPESRSVLGDAGGRRAGAHGRSSDGERGGRRRDAPLRAPAPGASRS